MKNCSKPPKSIMPAQKTKKPCQIDRRLDKQGSRRQSLRQKLPQTTSPAVSEKLAKGASQLNILHLNVQGLQRKTKEIKDMLDTYSVHVALFQETLLPKEEVNVSGYTKFICSCRKCQGIATLVRNDVEATVTNSTIGDIDHQTILVWPKGKKNLKFTVHNIYYPNSSRTKFPVIHPTMKKTVIAGDFNAHIPSLGYPDTLIITSEVMKWRSLQIPPIYSCFKIRKHHQPFIVGLTARPVVPIYHLFLQISLTKATLRYLMT